MKLKFSVATLFGLALLGGLSSTLSQASEVVSAYQCYGFAETRGGYPATEAEGISFDQVNLILSPKVVLKTTNGTTYDYQPQTQNEDLDHAHFYSSDTQESIDFESALARNGEQQAVPSARSEGYVRIRNFGSKKSERKYKCFRKSMNLTNDTVQS